MASKRDKSKKTKTRKKRSAKETTKKTSTKTRKKRTSSKKSSTEKKVRAKKSKSKEVVATGFTPSYSESLQQVETSFRLGRASLNKSVRRETSISTGILVYDLIVGNGGLIPGWYTNFGPEQSAKSTAVMRQVIAAVVQDVPLIVYMDYEGCVTEDTEIRSRGKWLPLKSLLPKTLPEQAGPLDITLPIDSVGRDGVPARLYYGGVQNTTRIELSDGKYLEGYRHPVLICRDDKIGWEYIEDLKVGDRLISDQNA